MNSRASSNVQRTLTSARCTCSVRPVRVWGVRPIERLRDLNDFAARGVDRLEIVAREIEELGGKAVTGAGNVSDPSVTERLAELTEAAFGPIDVWINNAMTSVYSKIWDMPPEGFRRVTEVTYLNIAEPSR